MSKRKQFTPEQKVAIIRRHLVEAVPVSDLCDEYEIHATQYYNWQKQFFENGAAAFARRPNKANEKRRQNACDKKSNRSRKNGQSGHSYWGKCGAVAFSSIMWGCDWLRETTMIPCKLAPRFERNLPLRGRFLSNMS